MNKKQRNRKLVLQNKRNRIINRRYSSTIKTLFKFFSLKLKQINNSETNLEEKNKQKIEVKQFVQKLYSIIDKAIKKQVIHKNTGIRKKSKIGKIFSKMG
jgi:small subunit ribosomal protein S20